MNLLKDALALGLPLANLLFLYFCVDQLLRGGVWGKLGAHSRSQGAFLGFNVVLFSALGLVLRYGDAFSLELTLFASAVACLLAWNAATRDLDPTRGMERAAAQLIVLPAALLSFVSPAFLVLTGILLSHFLRFWLHHATFPMRVLTVLIAATLHSAEVDVVRSFWGPDAIAPMWTSAAPIILFLVILQVSHYFITALAKGFLGPHPLSWVTDNKLHYLAASAYSWGWGRFVPWESWRRFVSALERLRIPLQIGAFGLELLAPLALLHRGAGVGFSLAFALFHCGVFAVSGLLFWDWIIVDVLIAALLFSLPASEASLAFGVVPLILGLAVLGLFPLRHKLWKPMPLGWFDTPLTARIHWRVVGVSGKTYGLYNDFMCPHERLYGRVHGCFYAPRPALTYHLGEVWKLEVRDGIEEAGPHPEKLARLREKYGILPRSDELRSRHEEFLGSFFAHLNANAKKSILPKQLSWLKAPGDQIFYWGELVAYSRQEPVCQIQLRYVEEFFDGTRLVRLHDEEVARIPVPDVPPASCPEEPTPKELDDYLLGLAAGRLIDIPQFKNRYADVLSEM